MLISDNGSDNDSEPDSSEGKLLELGYKYIEENTSDTLFIKLFWQYQRIRCSVFRYLTLEPGTAGLDCFKAAYNRIDDTTKHIKNLREESAFRVAGKDCTLRSLEVRKSPPASWAEVAEDSRKLQCGREKSNQKNTEIGVTYHPLKEYCRNSKMPHSSPDNGDWRYGEWFRARQIEARAMQTAFEWAPQLLPFVCAVDIANAELAQPLWLTYQLISPLRDSTLKKKYPLRVTIHIAEEYRRVSEGLRNIGEALEFGIIRKRDRLGHALVLGASAWKQETTLQPREDRLFDLLWMLRLPQKCSPESSRTKLRSEAADIAQKIFGKKIEQNLLQELVKYLYSPRLFSLGFPQLLSPGRSTISRLVCKYLRDPIVYQRATRLIEIPSAQICDNEARLLSAAQTAIRYRLRRLKVVVETNPSSNLLIGDYMGILQHPLSSAVTDSLGAAPDFSINSDDPITFATCLADEYMYMYASLLGNLRSPQAAKAALEEIRATAWKSRFTTKESAKPGKFSLFPNRKKFLC